MLVHVEHFPRSAGQAGAIELDDAAGQTAMDLLRHMDVPPDSVLVLRSGTPIPLDSVLDAGERLKIVWTISGG